MITRTTWYLTVNGDSLDEHIQIQVANNEMPKRAFKWLPQECADCGAPTQDMEWCSDCTRKFFNNLQRTPQCYHCGKRLNSNEYEAFGGLCARCDHVYSEFVQDIMQEITYDE